MLMYYHVVVGVGILPEVAIIVVALVSIALDFAVIELYSVDLPSDLLMDMRGAVWVAVVPGIRVDVLTNMNVNGLAVVATALNFVMLSPL